MSQQANDKGFMAQGRLVWTIGQSLFEGRGKTDMRTKQPVIDTKTGLQVIEYGFGLAIPKIDPATGQPTAMYSAVWQALHQEAYKIFPSGHLPKDFAMKYKDGDTEIDSSGVPYSAREGYAGHFVLSCTTRIPFKGYVFQGGNNIQVATGIKCGDYVNVQISLGSHAPAGTAKGGLYVNPSAVQLVQEGKEIVNSPSGDQMFGTNAPAYAGQVVAHTAPTMPNMGAPAPGMHPGQAPMQGHHAPAAAPAMPGQYAHPGHTAPPAQPHYDVLPQTVHPGHHAAPPAMPGQYAHPGHTAPPAMGNAPVGPAGHHAAPPVNYAHPAPGTHPSQPMTYPSNPGYPAQPGHAHATPPMPGLPR
jgi:hypothetical protein